MVKHLGTRRYLPPLDFNWTAQCRDATVQPLCASLSSPHWQSQLALPVPSDRSEIATPSLAECQIWPLSIKLNVIYYISTMLAMCARARARVCVCVCVCVCGCCHGHRLQRSDAPSHIHYLRSSKVKNALFDVSEAAVTIHGNTGAAAKDDTAK